MMPTTARPKITCWPSNSVDDRLDLSREVRSFSASASLDAPEGAFTIEIVAAVGYTWRVGKAEAQANLAAIIRPNAVISIGMDAPGGIVFGLVSTVTQGLSLIGGQTVQTFAITGMTMGRLLTQDVVALATLVGPESESFRQQIGQIVGENSPLLGLMNGDVGPLTGNGDNAVNAFTAATVRAVVEWALNAIPTMRLPILGSVYGDANPGAWILTENSVTTWNDARVWSDALQTYAGSAWGFITSALDLDFYEVFIDSRRSTDGSDIPDIELVVRPRPFDSPTWETRSTPVQESTGLTWEDLRCRITGDENHVVQLEDVYQSSIGVGQMPIYSWYQVTGDFEPIYNSGGVALGLAYPMIDAHAMQRYGVRPYNARIALVGADVTRVYDEDPKYQGEVINEIREFRNRLVNWHRYNPWLLSGQITIRGRDDVRPGDPVLLPWMSPSIGTESGVRFYCTSVSWSWSIGAPYTSTLTLTRGCNNGMIAAIKQQIRNEANVSLPSTYAPTGALNEDGTPELAITVTPNDDMLVGA